jgi:hypothetical protein
VLSVRGREDIECLNTLTELNGAESAKIVLDPSGVTLANRDATRVLAVCEFKGIETQELSFFVVDGLTKNRHITRRGIPRLQASARVALQLGIH